MKLADVRNQRVIEPISTKRFEFGMIKLSGSFKHSFKMDWYDSKLNIFRKTQRIIKDAIR